MPTYMILADVHEEQFQNPQELVSVWGDIRNDVAELGGDLRESYAAMGDHDFVILYDVADAESALQVALAVERYGIDATSMRLFPVDRLGDVVEDV